MSENTNKSIQLGKTQIGKYWSEKYKSENSIQNTNWKIHIGKIQDGKYTSKNTDQKTQIRHI